MSEKKKAPKFFFPLAQNDAEAEAGYQAVAKFASAPAPERKDRIWSVTWLRNGNRHYAVVGEPLAEFDGELVYAILHDGKNYCICTPHHGVLSGYPIFVGPEENALFARFSPD